MTSDLLLKGDVDCFACSWLQLRFNPWLKVAKCKEDGDEDSETGDDSHCLGKPYSCKSGRGDKSEQCGERRTFKGNQLAKWKGAKGLKGFTEHTEETKWIRE